MIYTEQTKERTFLYIFMFFTTWNFLLVLFHQYTHNYINLIYLSLMTVTIGMYFSFINPRKFVYYLDNEQYTFTGIEKFILIDLFLHIAVLGYVLTKYSKFYNKSTSKQLVNSILLLILYLTIIPFKKTYGVSFGEIAPVGICVTLVYIAFCL